jgi:hypothetical protein
MPQKPTLADRIISFNRDLSYSGTLPAHFQVLNPFQDNPETAIVMNQFYQKFYSDNQPRKFIIGINPSRHGAGVTGVPFTDTKRLDRICGIKMQSAQTHEISSVFMYDVIEEFGGATAFYREFYINSPFPLAIIRKTGHHTWVNANYYDHPMLFEMLRPFMVDSLKKHIQLGLQTGEVFVLGKKNATFLSKLNKTEHLFERMTALDHPRYIQQYKSKEKLEYIANYLRVLRS